MENKFKSKLKKIGKVFDLSGLEKKEVKKEIENHLEIKAFNYLKHTMIEKESKIDYDEIKIDFNYHYANRKEEKIIVKEENKKLFKDTDNFVKNQRKFTKKKTALEKYDDKKRMALRYGESENMTFKKDFRKNNKRKSSWSRALRNLGYHI